MPTNPLAVLLSDVHYDQHTLPLADAATRMAINHANELNVPLVVCGDLHNTKANMRGECVNALLETFKLAKIKPYIIVGNHDRLNEKAPAHALNFLSACAILIDKPVLTRPLNIFTIPYQHSATECEEFIKTIPAGSTIIMHQGVQGALPGDYTHDKSAIEASTLANFRTVSGHYHRRQDIRLVPMGTAVSNKIGLLSYVGNPYTLGFGEAKDPEKGYQILMGDGSLQHIPTNLRKHVVRELSIGWESLVHTRPNLGDLSWIKISGTREYLNTITRAFVQDKLNMGDCSFKLTLIPNDASINTQLEHKPTQTGHEMLDSLIDSLSNTSDERKIRLKQLWKGL